MDIFNNGNALMGMAKKIPERNNFQSYLITNTTGNGLSNVIIFVTNYNVFVFFKIGGVLHEPYFEINKVSICCRGVWRYNLKERRKLLFKLCQVLQIDSSADIEIPHCNFRNSPYLDIPPHLVDSHKLIW